MTPLARQSDVEAASPAGVMALAMITGGATHRAKPANDVNAEGRQNLLVRRRKRLARREAR